MTHLPPPGDSPEASPSPEKAVHANLATKEKALEKVQPMDTPFRQFHADRPLVGVLGIDLTTLTEGRETMRPD